MLSAFGGATGMIVIFAGVALLVLFVILTYNGLVALRNQFKNAWAQIDVQLKRRYDLIPNLVETAKAFLQHERETLTAVIAARNAAAHASQRVAADPGNTQAMGAFVAAETALSGSMGRFFGLSEAYPDLKGNANMTQLSEELTSTENKISFARQAFNDAVMRYNIKREKFPAVVFAGMLGFHHANLFEVTNPVEREAVRVSFK